MYSVRHSPPGSSSGRAALGPAWRLRSAGVLVWAAAACAPAPRPAEPPAPGRPAPGVAPAVQRAPSLAGLERRHTGQASPSITLKNSYVLPQHVFIDGAPAGELAPGSSRTFGVSAGAHTLGCADSPNPDDRAVSVTEVFEPGYAYRYEVVER